MSMIKNRSKRSGFTIVELLIIVIVIGILTAILALSFSGISKRAMAAVMQSNLKNASNKLKMYQVEYGEYPNLDTNTYCPKAPSILDQRYCLGISSGYTYQYSYDNSANPQTFYLSESKSGLDISYHISDGIAPTLSYSNTTNHILNSTATDLNTGWTREMTASHSGSISDKYTENAIPSYRIELHSTDDNIYGSKRFVVSL